MKKLTTEEIAEVVIIFKENGCNFDYKLNEDKTTLYVGSTTLCASEARALLKRGYIFVAYSAIGDTWHDKSLTLHVFKSGK